MADFVYFDDPGVYINPSRIEAVFSQRFHIGNGDEESTVVQFVSNRIVIDEHIDIVAAKLHRREEGVSMPSNIVERVAAVVQRQLVGDTTERGTIAHREWFGRRVAEALRAAGLLVATDWGTREEEVAHAE